MEGSWLVEFSPATFDSDFKAAVLACKLERRLCIYVPGWRENTLFFVL